LTIAAGRGPSPPFYHHLKQARRSDALLLPSFNILPSYPWHMHRGIQLNVSHKGPVTHRSLVTAFTCRPGYSLRYEKGKGPSCYKKVRKLLRCPKGLELIGRKSVKCVRREKKCPNEYKLRVHGDRSVCVKKVSSCPMKYILIPLKGGDFVCLEQVHKCEKGYKLRLTGDNKTECVKTILTCTPGFDLEQRPGEKYVCVMQVTGKKQLCNTRASCFT
jgi:hypothetical protein